MHYNRLVALMLTGNIAFAAYGAFIADWWTSDGADLRAIAMVAQVNLAVAVLVRQQYVINALAWLVTRPPSSWPLRMRWMLGKYYHFGGVHVGSAVAGTLWYLALVATLLRDAINGVGDASHAHVFVAATIVTAFAVMIVMALPRLRAAQHDRFEVTPPVLRLGRAGAGVGQHDAVRERPPRRPVARLGAIGRTVVLARGAHRSSGDLALAAASAGADHLRADRRRTR